MFVEGLNSEAFLNKEILVGEVDNSMLFETQNT